MEKFGPGGLLGAVAGVVMLIGAPLADRMQLSLEQNAYGDAAVVVADPTPGWYTAVAWLLIVAGLGMALFGRMAARSLDRS